jgi:hypothetical protein
VGDGPREVSHADECNVRSPRQDAASTDGRHLGGSVYAYAPRQRRWRRLPDALASIGSRIFAIGGQPGLSASAANESLSLK